MLLITTSYGCPVNQIHHMSQESALLIGPLGTGHF